MGLHTVDVRFKRELGNKSDTIYSYLTYDEYIKKGETVIVDSPVNGYVCVVVEDVFFNTRKGNASKFIVSRVFDEEYKRYQARLLRREAIKLELERKLKLQKEREKYTELAQKDVEASKLLNELDRIDELDYNRWVG